MKGSRVLLFIICLLLWFTLSWSVTYVSIIAGLLISLLISVITGDLFTENPHKLLDIKRYGWFVVYVLILFWDMLIANLELLVMIIKPKININPAVLEINTGLKSGTGITALANTVSLISGMSTIDISPDNSVLEVHFLDNSSKHCQDRLLAKIKIYENMFKKIYEEK